MSIVTCRSHLSRGALQLEDDESSGHLFNYIGGSTGPWRVTQILTHSGQALKPVSHVDIITGRLGRLPVKPAWILRAVVSSTRYITREEPGRLGPFWPIPAGMDCTCAALILIRKSTEWWNLAFEERREILEARSRRLATRLRLLPKFLGRLQLNRYLGEPFDFVTWFEYAPQDTTIFDDVLGALRACEEWGYVERETDIRLTAC